MCPGCERVWSILHVIWSAIYVSSGAAQLVAGIFFLLALPSLILACNLLTGIWNIFMGIGVGMVACCGQISLKRQETLLYMIISILIINTINAIVTEWGFYYEDLGKLQREHRYNILVQYASYATRIAAAGVILGSFLDSQLTFCSMQSSSSGAKKKLRGSHEQVSDIEYIIPRPKSSSKPQVYNAYSQSWVFETDPNNKSESPYLKLPQETPKRSPQKKKPEENGDTTYLIDNPMVHIEEASDDSTSNSDRKLCYMKSFSRSTSPAVLSNASSQISLAHNSAPIYECLEKLTHPDTFRSRLNSALSNKEEPQYQTPQIRQTSPQIEKVQYASLMKELSKAIGNKKESPVASPHDSTKSSSRRDSSKNSDVEFSKELEAALQLIQDLESPNTIETPSETNKSSLGEKEVKPLKVWNCSDSEKTLSAAGSIGSPQNDPPELFTFKPNGKGARIVVQYSDSQSTSGYSSPTHNKGTPKCWSTTSSLNGSHNDLGKPLAYTIHNTKSTAVISLYAPPNPPEASKAKSITLVNITGDNQPVNLNPIIKPGPPKQGWNVASLLRKKKSSPPKLCPELEGAIIKSESLAYLTELELLARHQRNKDIHRQIEQRVQQQLGTPWTDSEG